MYVVILLLVFCSEIDVISYAMSRIKLFFHEDVQKVGNKCVKYEISMLVINWSYIHALLRMKIGIL
jgi:hypothetical protein